MNIFNISPLLVLMFCLGQVFREKTHKIFLPWLFIDLDPFFLGAESSGISCVFLYVCFPCHVMHCIVCESYSALAVIFIVRRTKWISDTFKYTLDTVSLEHTQVCEYVTVHGVIKREVYILRRETFQTHTHTLPYGLGKG